VERSLSDHPTVNSFCW